jgi:hypothetical protein
MRALDRRQLIIEIGKIAIVIQSAEISPALDSRQISQGSLTLLLVGQRLVDLEDFRYVFKRFDERRNLPRTSIHRVFARIEGGEREMHVLTKPLD